MPDYTYRVIQTDKMDMSSKTPVRKLPDNNFIGDRMQNSGEEFI